VWFAPGTDGAGSPSLSLVVPGGLVLKVIRNGNHEIRAVDMRDSGVLETVVDDAAAAMREGVCATSARAGWELVDPPVYRARVNAAYVTTVDVLTGQILNYSDSLSSAVGEAGVLRFAGGTVAVRRVRLPEIPRDCAVFAELTHRSNGDAYDRTGSVFLIPEERPVTFLAALRRGVAAVPAVTDRGGRSYQGIALTDSFVPPLELMRFITPFGVGHYNEQVQVEGIAWEDSAVYKMDVTDLRDRLRGPVWIGVFIGNYDPGGHHVSLRLRYYPNNRTVDPAGPEATADELRQRQADPSAAGSSVRRPTDPSAAGPSGAPGDGGSWSLPLFNTANVLEMAGQEYGRLFATDTLAVTFDVPPGVSDCRLRFITTGHGGWEAGDEFNQKINHIFLDGVEVARLVPWREDCATFRRLNPASGNFWNELSSSDFSRSGWCPGTTVNPFQIPLPRLTPGRHEIRVAIAMGAPEGGSYSAWNVSGVVLGRFAF